MNQDSADAVKLGSGNILHAHSSLKQPFNGTNLQIKETSTRANMESMF
jgi:hypothetical protein